MTACAQSLALSLVRPVEGSGLPPIGPAESCQGKRKLQPVKQVHDPIQSRVIASSSSTTLSTRPDIRNRFVP
jgi:hypothetical protein